MISSSLTTERTGNEMIEENEVFNGSWPYKAQYFAGQGFRQHYVDEGSRDSDETFVLVHGEPTWGYIYRNFIPRLSEIGRVVVPDHMGFGKSETPQDREYSAEEHCDNLDALLRADTNTRYAAHAQALAGGWLSVPEIRAIEDLDIEEDLEL